MIYVDAGNTAIKVKTGEEFKSFSDDKLFIDFLNSLDNTNVIISSVRSDDWQERIASEVKQVINWVAVTKNFRHLINAYGDEFHSLGVDRWVAMIGASEICKQVPLMVIDIGTAVTIDWIDAQGNHLGGHIVPGFSLLKRSLTKSTARIDIDDDKSFDDELSSSTQLKGKNTEKCISYGCHAMLKAYLASEIKNYRSIESSARIIVTGGGHSIIEDKLVLHEPFLIFKGLEAIDKYS